MKKFLHILLFSSVALLFNGCISGWGWLVPYNLQPSYHKFKKMCKLNELPNTEEKYNKILGYFDLSLDTLDWEELNKTKRLLNTTKYDKSNHTYKFEMLSRNPLPDDKYRY